MSDSFNNTNALAEVLRDNVVGGFDAIQAGASTVVGYTSGASLPALAGGYGEVLLQTAPEGDVTLPADYAVLYDSVASPATVIGNGGSVQAVVANSGALTFDFSGGNGVVYTADNPAGNLPASGDVVFLDGAGTSYVAAGEGQDTIVADSGSNNIAVGGGANQVFLEGGSNLVGSEGSDQIVVGTGSVAAVGSATISVSGDATVYGGASPLLLLGGAGFVSLYPQSDGTTGALTSTGPVTVFGGAGGGTFYGGAIGGNLMVAGTAATTLVGGGANDSLFATGSGNDVLQAIGDNSYLIGSDGTGDNAFFAGAGNTIIYGGSGQDTYVMGTGNTTLVAGSGADQIDLTNGQAGGVDIIVGFKPGIDQVNLFGYDSGDGSAAANALEQAAANSAGGSTFVTLADNTTIQFYGTPALAGNSFVG